MDFGPPPFSRTVKRLPLTVNREPQAVNDAVDGEWPTAH